MKHRAEKITGIFAVIILFVCQSAFGLKAKVSRAQAREETIEIAVERNVRVSATGGPFVEPTVSADPTNANVLIASSSEVVPEGIIAWVFRSEDSGRTWFAVALPDMREGLARHDYVHALDTWTTFATNGTAYLSVLAARNVRANSWETRIMVYRSTDHGRTWTGPVPFRFAEPGNLASILIEADAIDVRERFLNFHIEAPISPDEFWELRSATSATLREKLADLSKEQTVQVAREVREAALEFFPKG